MKTKEEIIKRRKQFPRVFVSYNGGKTWGYAGKEVEE